jgi:tetratricopeptide (TPR) repeat protein
MESRWQLDATGHTPARGSLCSVVGLLFFYSLSGFSQSQSEADHASTIQELFESERWEQVVTAVEASPARGAQIDFCYGSALAHLGRWSEARAAFLAGRELNPRDKRFPVELGGVAFKQKRYPEAAHWLRQALQLEPNDSYANDLLATVYFLQGNTNAALKYWNRIGKPHLENIEIEPGLQVDPSLLDRAIAFAPASTLRLADFLTTETRVNGLGIFPAARWRLEALDNGNFTMNFQAQERDGWGNGRWQALASTLRGVFYQTIYPQYSNFRSSAINFTTLLRWDAEKRRWQASLSSPLAQNPKYRYEIDVDLRNENWDLRQSSAGPAPTLGALNLRRESVTADFTSLNNRRWTWLAGGELSYRDYRNVFPGPSLPQQALLNGFQLKQFTQIDYALRRLPERRFKANAIVTSDAGTIWSASAHSFEKVRGSISLDWSPQASGDDYAMHGQIRSGRTLGSVPFDELFMLGMERDNDLWMRGHVGTRDGRKGSAPLGRNYFLSNWEIDKRIYGNGLFSVKLSPFVDTGKITDPLPGLGSAGWLWDTGLQLKLRVLGFGVTLVYGRDLRSSHNAFYATAQ